MKTNAPRLITLGVLALGGCASTRSTPDSAAPVHDVVFSANSARGKFTITCRPRTEAIGRGTTWVDACNERGRDAVANAARQGLIALVDGPAFGMASTFLTSMAADAAYGDKIMSRELPLIGKTP